MHLPLHQFRSQPAASSQASQASQARLSKTRGKPTALAPHRPCLHPQPNKQGSS